MDLNEIVKIQKEFDSKHGWTPSEDIKTIISFINKDIIGIIGELGEFSNEVKKINLIGDSINKDNLIIEYLSRKDNLAEELVDTFIYLIRISSHMNLDLEKKYFEKLNKNEKRFKGFEIND